MRQGELLTTSLLAIFTTIFFLLNYESTRNVHRLRFMTSGLISLLKDPKMCRGADEEINFLIIIIIHLILFLFNHIYLKPTEQFRFTYHILEYSTVICQHTATKDIYLRCSRILGLNWLLVADDMLYINNASLLTDTIDCCYSCCLTTDKWIHQMQSDANETELLNWYTSFVKSVRIRNDRKQDRYIRL